jgi:hypothetical protein
MTRSSRLPVESPLFRRCFDNQRTAATRGTARLAGSGGSGSDLEQVRLWAFPGNLRTLETLDAARSDQALRKFKCCRWDSGTSGSIGEMTGVHPSRPENGPEGSFPNAPTTPSPLKTRQPCSPRCSFLLLLECPQHRSIFRERAGSRLLSSKTLFRGFRITLVPLAPPELCDSVGLFFIT